MIEKPPLRWSLRELTACSRHGEILGVLRRDGDLMAEFVQVPPPQPRDQRLRPPQGRQLLLILVFAVAALPPPVRGRGHEQGYKSDDGVSGVHGMEPASILASDYCDCDTARRVTYS